MKNGVKDRVILSVIAGLAGVAAKQGVNLGLRKLGMSNVGYSTMAASLFVDKKRSAGSNILGYIADGVIGTSLGLPLTYIMGYTGRDRSLVKGALYGGITWVALLGVLQNVGVSNFSPGRPRTNLMELFSNLAYGITVSSIIKKFGDESLFVDSTEETTTEEYNKRRTRMLYSNPVLPKQNNEAQNQSRQ